MEQVNSHLEQGIEAFESGDMDTAVAELEQAAREDPDNFKTFNYLGAAYAAEERYDAAIGAFKVAEQLGPKHAGIHYNIGQAYEAAGIPHEAFYEYEEALKINPGYTKAIEALAALRKRIESST